MVQKIIQLGLADKGNGDPLRIAFGKVNDNFTELYNHVSAGVVVDATAPADPGEGDLWWDPESGRMYVYYGSSWVDASPVDGAGISSTNELVNGAYTVSLGSDGNLSVPDRITFSDDTWQSTAFIGHAYDLRNSPTGNLYVTLDDSGSINTPLLLPLTFTAVLDPAHYIGEGTLVLEGDAWEYTVQFQVGQDGTVQTMINNQPWPSNPGYINGLVFEFLTSDHGIPGYTFTFTLNSIQNPGPGVYTANPAVSEPPDYPATIQSLGAVKLAANSASWTFGTDGTLTLPGGTDTITSNTNGLDLSVLGIDEETVLTVNFSRSGGLTVPSAIYFNFLGTNTGLINAQSDELGIAGWPDKAVHIAPNDGLNGVFKFGTDGALTFPDTSTYGNSTLTGAVDSDLAFEVKHRTTVSATEISGGSPFFTADITTNDDITVVQPGWEVNAGTELEPIWVTILTADEFSLGIYNITPVYEEIPVGFEFVEGQSYTFRNPVPGSKVWTIRNQTGGITGPGGVIITNETAPLGEGTYRELAIELPTADGLNEKRWTFSNDGDLSIDGKITHRANSAELDLNNGSTNNVLLTTTDGFGDTSLLLDTTGGALLFSNRNVMISAATGGSEAYDVYTQAEANWVEARNQDAILSAPETRPWAGMSSGDAYPELMGYSGPNPPSATLPQLASTAIYALSQWQAQQDISTVSVAAADKVWLFKGDGELTVPGAIRKNGALYLNSGGETNSNSATVLVNGQGGNITLRTSDGTDLQSLTFDNTGVLTLPPRGSINTPGGAIGWASADDINFNLILDSTNNVGISSFGNMWTFNTSGELTLPNSTIFRQSTNDEVTAALAAYNTAIATWETSRINEYMAGVSAGFYTLEGRPYAGWDDVSGTTATAYRAIVINAANIQNSPSSPPTPLLFTPALSSSLFSQLSSQLNAVINTYADWQALLPSVDIVAGDEKLSLLSNNKIEVPGIVQTTPEEDIVIRIRYAGASSPPGTTTYTNQDFTFGTNGSLTFPDASVQTTAFTGGLESSNGYYYFNIPNTGVETNSSITWKEGSTERVVMNYVPADDRFVISTNQGGTPKYWFFGDNGVLTLPESGAQIASDVTFTGSVTFQNTANYVQSTNTIYTDSLIELHAPTGGIGNAWTVNDGTDIGLRFHYYNGADKNAALFLDNGTWRLKFVVDGTESGGQFSHSGLGDIEAANFYGNLNGGVIASTIEKTGLPIVDLGQTRVLTLTPSPSNDGNWQSAGLSEQFDITISGTTVSIKLYVDEGGNISVNVISSTSGSVSVGASVTISDGVHGGNDYSINPVTVTVASVSSGIPTAIDLTKSVNELTDGAYSLANGVEGQILYLTTKYTVTSPSTIHVQVATFRTNGSLTTDYILYPFANSGVCMLVYNNSSWQASNITSVPTLTTARNINGVAFDGSADITVTADANTLSGTTLKSTVVSSSLTSLGTISSLRATTAAGNSSSTASSTGYIGLPQNTKSAPYTLQFTDHGKHIYVTATTTVTIPANSSVAFPIGTSIDIVSGPGATTTIAITTDTMYLAGAGTTGSRTLAAYGWATLVKVTSTSWFIRGNGLT